MGELTFAVPPAWDGQRLQDFLRRECGLSWRMVVRLRHPPGRITVDGVLRRTVDPVRAGETVVLTLPADTLRIEPTALPIAVVYEDESLLVADKPPAIAVHPSAGRPEPTLANAVVAHYAAAGVTCSFRPVNRLDRNTSGLLLAAKNAHVAYALTRKPEKEYLAVVCGTLTGEGTVDQPIRLREGSFIAREVGEGGKPSVTHYTVLSTGDGCSLLRLRLETGRTHQIRVHMAWLGYPLAGDDLYGGDTADIGRQALHCARMQFCHPLSGEPLDLRAPLPGDMRALCAARHLTVPEEYL